MSIMKLPDGRLRIPFAASGEDWTADGTETIGADDPRYAEYLLLALAEEERAARNRDDEAASAELLARWGARYDAQPGRQTA